MRFPIPRRTVIITATTVVIAIAGIAIFIWWFNLPPRMEEAMCTRIRLNDETGQIEPGSCQDLFSKCGVQFNRAGDRYTATRWDECRLVGEEGHEMATGFAWQCQNDGEPTLDRIGTCASVGGIADQCQEQDSVCVPQ